MLSEEILVRSLKLSLRSRRWFARAIRSTRIEGGEVQRVNLTTLLGASLVPPTLRQDETSNWFASARDVGRLVRVSGRARQRHYASRGGRSRGTHHSCGR